MKAMLLLAILFFAAQTSLLAQRVEKPQGKYILYRQDNPGEKAAEMIITSWKGDRFLVRGNGWIGEGEISENEGYYEWKFDDGRTGKTKFKINEDGTLSGHVEGSGINWKYYAKKAD